MVRLNNVLIYVNDLIFGCSDESNKDPSQNLTLSFSKMYTWVLIRILNANNVFFCVKSERLQAHESISTNLFFCHQKK